MQVEWRAKLHQVAKTVKDILTRSMKMTKLLIYSVNWIKTNVIKIHI